MSGKELSLSIARMRMKIVDGILMMFDPPKFYSL